MHFSTFEAHNQRQRKLGLATGSNDAVGNRRAVDNAAKDVDQNGLHLRVGRDDLERLRHLPHG